MRKAVPKTDLTAGQMFFEYRRTLAGRTAAGELIDVTRDAKAAGFRWPLAVSAELWQHVQTIPRGAPRSETVAARWQHVFLLAGTAAAQIIRENSSELQINVVLRTSDAPDRSREHIKTLHLNREKGEEAGAVAFILGCHVGKERAV